MCVGYNNGKDSLMVTLYGQVEKNDMPDNNDKFNNIGNKAVATTLGAIGDRLDFMDTHPYLSGNIPGMMGYRLPSAIRAYTNQFRRNPRELNNDYFTDKELDSFTQAVRFAHMFNDDIVGYAEHDRGVRNKGDLDIWENPSMKNIVTRIFKDPKESMKYTLGSVYTHPDELGYSTVNEVYNFNPGLSKQHKNKYYEYLHKLGENYGKNVPVNIETFPEDWEFETREQLNERMPFLYERDD